MSGIFGKIADEIAREQLKSSGEIITASSRIEVFDEGKFESRLDVICRDDEYLTADEIKRLVKSCYKKIDLDAKVWYIEMSDCSRGIVRFTEDDSLDIKRELYSSTG